MFFLQIIDLLLLIVAVIAQFFITTKKLEIPIGIPTKEAKPTISKCLI